MSSNRFTIGWIGELKEPVGEELRDEVSEALAEKGFGLNHEGTLVYQTTDGDTIEDGFHIHILESNDGANQFFDEVWSEGFFLVQSTIRPFVDLWYDAADSGHDTMTLAEFREKCK